MKITILILFSFCCCCTSKHFVLAQTVEKDRHDKESMEIAYITNCIRENKKVDSLIEWKVKSNGEIHTILSSNGKIKSGYSFEYKGNLVYFTIEKNTSNIYLKEINYFKNSFHKMIFFTDTLSEYEITNQTRLRVWMSHDKLSIYFCVINPDEIIIWVLTNGNTVYTMNIKIGYIF